MREQDVSPYLLRPPVSYEEALRNRAHMLVARDAVAERQPTDMPEGGVAPCANPDERPLYCHQCRQADV